MSGPHAGRCQLDSDHIGPCWVGVEELLPSDIKAVVDEAHEFIHVKDPVFREQLRECMKVLDVKGQDYTAGENSRDRLYNFRDAAARSGVSIEQAWFVYFYKHFMSVVQYVRHGQVASEPIEGRITDIINYALLFRRIVSEKKTP